MFRTRSIFSALALAATLAGANAQAAFSVDTTLTSSSTPATALTLTANDIVNGPTPTPTGGISFNFLDITYAGSTANVSTAFTVTGTFAVNNNGLLGNGTFSQAFTYNLVNGFGNLTAGAGSITPVVAGVTFSPIQFASPTFADGLPSTGNLSTVLTAAAVPEPASVTMMGLGVLAITGLAWRRRRSA